MGGRRGSLASLGGGHAAECAVSGVYAVAEGAMRWSGSLADVAAESGDAAALIEAYKDCGTDALNLVTGSFAVAVIDEPNGKSLIAVDRMGVRPLCYTAIDGDGFRFGSTTDLVVEAMGALPPLSAQSLFNYVYFHVIPSPDTVFQGVSKLEPGQYALYQDGRLETGFYWQPAFENIAKSEREELQQQLMQRMRDAIERSAPDANTGAFLSGGLDSSTVCGLANERTANALPVYTIGFEQQGYDEMEFAQSAADHFGLDLRPYYATPDDVAEAIPLIASSYDEPFGNSSAVPAYLCGKLAHRDGVNRLLAGDGGDELFAGNERYLKQTVFEYYQRAPKILRKALLEPIASVIPPNLTRFTHKVQRYIEQANVPMPERLQTYNFLHIHDPAFIFTDGFLENVNPRNPLDQMDAWYQRCSSADLLDKMLAFDWKLTLADNDIRKVNVMCAAAGTDVSYPLLDDDLVEFSTQIPSGLKIEKRELRAFFKNTVASYLPSKIIHKEKHGFGLPFGEWVRNNSSLADVVMPSLDNLRNRNIVRAEFIEFLLEGNRNTHAAFFGNVIWVLTMLERWLDARVGSSDAVV